MKAETREMCRDMLSINGGKGSSGRFVTGNREVKRKGMVQALFMQRAGIMAQWGNTPKARNGRGRRVWGSDG